MKKQNKLTTKMFSIKEEDMDPIKKYFSTPEMFYSEMVRLEKDLLRNNEKLKPRQGTQLSPGVQLKLLYCIENGALLNGITSSKYGPALSRLRKKVTDENKCISSIELMLVDRIVASYWRSMRAETAYHLLVEPSDGVFSFDQVKINIFKEINKAIDQANRELSNNIILLKELKQPNLKVTVKTDNAFFAKNQQINNSQPGEDLKDNTEIIKP